MSLNRFYVYVYIDPRNLQEFYYGKGQGDRKLSHLTDVADSEKTRIIKEIKEEGLEPIIKVVARGLTEEQALLVEKTLIWKLGRNLANRSTGHFAQNFRPHETLHRDLFGFDYDNGVYCINIGEGDHRNWDDCRKYNFISAGQNWKKWGSRISALRPDDILCGYLSGHGYVGVARVLEGACPATSFRFNGKLLSSLHVIQPEMFTVPSDPMDGEFVLKVEWIVSRERNKAIGGDLSVWRSRSMLASLESQPETLHFLEKEFSVQFKKLLAQTKKAS
jgi:hypothetical protein